MFGSSMISRACPIHVDHPAGRSAVDLPADVGGVTQSIGPNTVSTVTIRIHLADCHTELGNLHDAVEGLNRAAADCETVLGTNSPLVVALQNEASALARAASGPPSDGVALSRGVSDRVGR
jgi:hypothetical protein